MPILKPNTPMISQGQEFYPLTHASQIIKSDGTRLEQDGKIIINGGAGGGGAVDSVNGQTGEVVLTASDVGAVSTTGDTITGSIVSNTAAKGFVCTVGDYDVRLMVSSNGNRGLYDNKNSKWLLSEDASGNITLNGTAAKASKLESGSLAVLSCCDWSGEIAASGYTSRIDLDITQRSGYVFLDCTGYGSNSSYVCPYGMFKTEGGKLAIYFRNLSTSKITPSISFWGIYQKI